VSAAPRPLAGRRIAVTRPAHQARELAELIEAAGGSAFVFTVTGIRDVEDPRALDDLIDWRDEFDIAVFVSPNAVERALGMIAARRAFPRRLACDAIGPGGARALERHGITGIITPAASFDSEGLLAETAFVHVRGKRVVIFRGDGGRELLGETLYARGAILEFAECYRRVRPEGDAAPLVAACAGGGLDAITVTSSESVRNLRAMAGEAGWQTLVRVPFFAPHPRIAQAARERGAVAVLSSRPGDAGLVAALVEHFGRRAHDAAAPDAGERA